MARVRINNVVKHSTPADASVIFLEAIKIVNAAAPKTRDPALSSYSQIGILKLLGCPELAWVELWQIHNLQEIYNALLFYESRLDATHADFEPRLARKVWKPVDVVLNMIHHLPYPLEVASWDTEDEQEWKMWKPEWHLLFAVKSVIDLCKDDFPVMEGESYTKEKVRAALALLMKIHSITKGVHMKEIYRDCARVAPKTPQLIIPKSLQVCKISTSHLCIEGNADIYCAAGRYCTLGPGLVQCLDGRPTRKSEQLGRPSRGLWLNLLAISRPHLRP